MGKNINDLYTKFDEIKNMGWIKSLRAGSTGIGTTFEDLMGIQENSLEFPDYNGIEIKTKRKLSKYYITLFNSSPDGPYVNSTLFLKDLYGYPHYRFPNSKVLNQTIDCINYTQIGKNIFFRLKIDRENKKIYLCVFDANKKALEDDIYWDFDTLIKKIKRKLQTLAFITADQKFINGIEYFKYSTISVYKLRNFNNFIDLIEKGIIKITFRINIYLSGKRIYQTHDHGTAFSIKEEDLLKLYELY